MAVVRSNSLVISLFAISGRRLTSCRTGSLRHKPTRARQAIARMASPSLSGIGCRMYEMRTCKQRKMNGLTVARTDHDRVAFLRLFPRTGQNALGTGVVLEVAVGFDPTVSGMLDIGRRAELVDLWSGKRLKYTRLMSGE